MGSTSSKFPLLDAADNGGPMGQNSTIFDRSPRTSSREPITNG
jgi:hypothetical protein